MVILKPAADLALAKFVAENGVWYLLDASTAEKLAMFDRQSAAVHAAVLEARSKLPV